MLQVISDPMSLGISLTALLIALVAILIILISIFRSQNMQHQHQSTLQSIKYELDRVQQIRENLTLQATILAKIALDLTGSKETLSPLYEEIASLLNELRREILRDTGIIESHSTHGLSNIKRNKLKTVTTLTNQLNTIEEQTEASSQNTEDWAFAGHAFYETSEYEAAIEHFNRALELDPENGAVHLYLALAFTKLGKLEEAQNHFEQARQLLRQSIESSPSDPRIFLAWYYLGKTFEGQNKPDLAERSYRKSLNLCKELITHELTEGRFPAKLYDWLSIIYHHLQDDISEAQCYEEWLGHDPANEEVMYSLGSHYARIGNWTQAEKWLRKAIITNSYHTSAMNSLAVVLWITGRHQTAQPYIDEALTQEPGDPYYNHTKSEIYLALGKTKIAKTAALEALQKESRLGPIWITLGKIYESENELEKALACYINGVNFEPEREDEISKRAKAFANNRATTLQAQGLTPDITIKKGKVPLSKR